MGKRIMAWALLVGFVLLIANIMSYRFYLEISLAIYLVVCIGFVFYSRTLKPKFEPIEFNEYFFPGENGDIKMRIPQKNILGNEQDAQKADIAIISSKDDTIDEESKIVIKSDGILIFVPGNKCYNEKELDRAVLHAVAIKGKDAKIVILQD
ncbi:MAG: hypothetical protein WCQ41_01780 [Bacillota bacterium]